MRACRTDKNHKQIVRAFRDLGWYVLDISQLKKCCDLLVAKHRITVAVEVKDGTASKSKQKLTEGEKKFKEEWKGHYWIITSLAEVEWLNHLVVAGKLK